MKTFAPAQIEHFKREAKRRSRNSPTPLSHSQALNLIAAEHGYANWSLLEKASKIDERILSRIDLSNVPFPGSSRGVYVATIKVVDQDLLDRVESEAPRFRLPNRPGWLFRPVTLPQNRFAPYLDLSLGYMQGIFVEGLWTAILSRNGIQDHEIDRHIETLPEVLRTLRMQAAVTLSQWQKPLAEPTQPRFKLFFTNPQPSGVAGLSERNFATLEEAQGADLPAGCQKVGIPVGNSWYYYQASFGWAGPSEVFPGIG